MNYLSVENVTKSYGENPLFENISFGINKDQKIAFIAKNGTGKTSLLNIIAGKESHDSGQVVKRKGLNIVYLAQKEDLNPKLTIEETIFQSENPMLKVIEQYEHALLNMEDADAYQTAFDLMEQYQAWDFETQYKQILSKLKFEDLNLIVGTLSGGQKKRLSLAISLINKPDLLILDEPTNHLDLESIQAFNNSLKNFKGTVIFSTHDHAFAQTVANRIIEITPNGVIDRFTTFDEYLANPKIKELRAKMYA